METFNLHKKLLRSNETLNVWFGSSVDACFHLNGLIPRLHSQLPIDYPFTRSTICWLCKTFLRHYHRMNLFFEPRTLATAWLRQTFRLFTLLAIPPNLKQKPELFTMKISITGMRAKDERRLSESIESGEFNFVKFSARTFERCYDSTWFSNWFHHGGSSKGTSCFDELEVKDDVVMMKNGESCFEMKAWIGH